MTMKNCGSTVLSVFLMQLLNGLKIALQCQYDKFMWRNPHFVSQGGTVSVIAHSLGSVMLYDILREKCELDPQVSSTRQGPGAQTRDHAVRLSGSRGGVGYCVSMDTSMEDVDGAGMCYSSVCMMDVCTCIHVHFCIMYHH